MTKDPTDGLPCQIGVSDLRASLLLSDAFGVICNLHHCVRRRCKKFGFEHLYFFSIDTMYAFSLFTLAQAVVQNCHDEEKFLPTLTPVIYAAKAGLSNCNRR